jgi:hypothetical protein
MPEFFVNLFRARDRVSDFFPQQLAMALPHSLHGGLDGGLRHAELSAQLRVRPTAWLAGLKILQLIEQRRLATRRVLLSQLVQRRLQDGLGPPTFKNLIRCQLIHRFEEITTFAGRFVQRNKYTPASALLSPGLPALLEQKILEIGEQERSELSFLMA